MERKALGDRPSSPEVPWESVEQTSETDEPSHDAAMPEPAKLNSRNEPSVAEAQRFVASVSQNGQDSGLKIVRVLTPQPRIDHAKFGRAARSKNSTANSSVEILLANDASITATAETIVSISTTPLDEVRAHAGHARTRELHRCSYSPAASACCMTWSVSRPSWTSTIRPLLLRANSVYSFSYRTPDFRNVAR